MVRLLALAIATLGLLVAVARAQQPSAPIDVWLDVDAANGVGDVDDGLMMIQAFHSPELRVRGLSVVFGNTDVDKAEHVARQIIARFGPANMPVHRGAASGADLGQETDAVRAIAAALREAPMTIAAVGPVTNVGSLLKLHPELAPRITQVIVVAGRRPGQKFLLDEFKNRSKAAPPDFNFELDPEAMQVILDSGVRLVMAPWEVSSTVWVSRDDLAGLANRSDAGAWINRTSQYWLDRWEKGLSVAAFNPYDTLAIGWLTHPDLIHGFDSIVTIEQGPDDGATVARSASPAMKPYLHARPADSVTPNAIYLFKPDRAFKPVLFDTLAGVNTGPKPGSADSGRDRTLSTSPQAPTFDHAAFDRVVHRFVNAEGLVDYAGLKQDSTDLDTYLASLASANLDSLAGDERLALLLNAYNAFTLRLILDHYPITSIKDIPEAERWKAVRWNLAGRTVSLDTIEHELIRPVFNDPRIHFALVCAGYDCPPLRNEAYTGRWVDAQLDDQARRFHAGPKWLRFDAESGTLALSSIYKWYAKDFETGAGEGHGLTVVARHAARYTPALKAYLRRGGTRSGDGAGVALTWLDYDWRLNAQ